MLCLFANDEWRIAKIGSVNVFARANARRERRAKGTPCLLKARFKLNHKLGRLKASSLVESKLAEASCNT